MSTALLPFPRGDKDRLLDRARIRHYDVRLAVRAGAARVRDEKGDECVPAPCAKGRGTCFFFPDDRARCTVHGRATRAVTEVRKRRGDGERRAIARYGTGRLQVRRILEWEILREIFGGAQEEGLSRDGGATSSEPGGSGDAMIRSWLAIYTGMAAEAS